MVLMGRKKNRKVKEKKPPLGYRLGLRLHSAGVFGRGAVRDPASLPGQAHGFFRNWFRKIWSVRGGGLYSVGYALTFIWLEAASIADEAMSSDGIGDFLRNQLFEFFTRFAVESFINMGLAFAWPMYIVKLVPPYGAIGLGLSFVLFPLLLKKPIEKWLFGDEAPPAAKEKEV